MSELPTVPRNEDRYPSTVLKRWWAVFNGDVKISPESDQPEDVFNAAELVRAQLERWGNSAEGVHVRKRDEIVRQYATAWEEAGF